MSPAREERSRTVSTSHLSVSPSVPSIVLHFIDTFTIAFDEFVIAKDAAQKDLAYKFIDYIYDGDVAAENMDYICGPNPVKPGIDKLDEDYRKVIILPEESLKNGQVLKNLDDDAMELYNKAWDRIKATEAK